MTDGNRKQYGMIIDGCNCAPISREQLIRTCDGGVTAISATILSPFITEFEPSMIDFADRLQTIAENHDVAAIVTSAAEIEHLQGQGRVGIILSSQHSEPVEKNLSLLQIMHRLGFRILQPTYNAPSLLGDGILTPKDKGITEQGRAWVHEMNRLGMLIDLSHCSHQTGAGFIAESADPVVFSHANAYALCPSPRNKPDDQIRAVAEKGGVTGAIAFPAVVRMDQRPTLADYLDQIEYLINLAGIEHVSIASDISEGTPVTREEWQQKMGPDGPYAALTAMLGDWFNYDTRFTEGFESLAQTPRIWDGIVGRGYSEDDVEKVLGRNLLRVFRAVWGA